MDRKAVAGPFEDIPALMIVSIGVAILLVSLANAFYSFEEDQEGNAEDLINDFIYALRNYDKLTEEGKGQGIFSAERLGGLNASLIIIDLNIECDFKLEFQEKSGYTSDPTYSTQTSQLPDVGQKEVIYRSTPIGISVGGIVHAGVMTVTIWGF
jgi:hypothetical protein